jgi:hypothetical protein
MLTTQSLIVRTAPPWRVAGQLNLLSNIIIIVYGSGNVSSSESGTCIGSSFSSGTCTKRTPVFIFFLL